LKRNYHSIAIFDKSWKDFKFIHVTDFHIARRNDFIAYFLKLKTLYRVKNQGRSFNELKFSEKLTLDRNYKFETGLQEERLDDFRHGKLNFNYNLRIFIKYVNEIAKSGNLDFIIITGDLIDYIDIAYGNKKYKNNFHVLLDILLGRDNKTKFTDKELLNQDEINVPIFTLVGNHDYRKGHYSLKLGKLYKKFGITRKDIKGYRDKKIFFYPKALYSRDKFLRDYYRYFNPNLNYMLEIGDQFNIIFLDTGQDSIANLHGILKSAPSTKGIKNYQINLLRSYLKLSKDKKVIIAMHTPPVSPNLSRFKRWRLKRKFDLNRKIEWSDFYEENLLKLIGTPRIDKILKFKYQTIMYNWKTFLKLLVGEDKKVKKKINVILCGHTHTLKEFRLKSAKEKEKTRLNLGFYLTPIYIRNPCKIYTEKYREKINSFNDPDHLDKWMNENKPIILQTQGIGPLSSKFKIKPPGFRFISIKDNKLEEIQLYSIHYST
jgi:predicted phosphodiesterase